MVMMAPPVAVIAVSQADCTLKTSIDAQTQKANQKQTDK